MFTGEAFLGYDACLVRYSPCTLSFHPRDDRTVVLSLRLNGVKELTRLCAGGGEPCVFFPELRAVAWPQARFHFASAWEFDTCRRVLGDVERVFGLRQLQETLEAVRLCTAQAASEDTLGAARERDKGEVRTRRAR